jgi:tRNA(Arg) A34 adenosine deaminase TadA
VTPDALMRRAIALSLDSVRTGGGPFGALIARDGVIVAEGTNRVTLERDPTAHAEVVAIRAACAALGAFSLVGCEIYTSCEPCPMCLGAVYWARLARIHYANDRTDAARIGFDDDVLYREFAVPPAARAIPMTRLLAPEARAAFEAWAAASDKTPY